MLYLNFDISFVKAKLRICDKSNMEHFSSFGPMLGLIRPDNAPGSLARESSLLHPIEEL